MGIDSHFSCSIYLDPSLLATKVLSSFLESSWTPFSFLKQMPELLSYDHWPELLSAPTFACGLTPPILLSETTLLSLWYSTNYNCLFHDIVLMTYIDVYTNAVVLIITYLWSGFWSVRTDYIMQMITVASPAPPPLLFMVYLTLTGVLSSLLNLGISAHPFP